MVGVTAEAEQRHSAAVIVRGVANGMKEGMWSEKVSGSERLNSAPRCEICPLQGTEGESADPSADGVWFYPISCFT